MSQLAVLMNGVEAGRLDYERGRLTLTYAEAWRSRRDAVPVSLSMPMTAEAHSGAVVEAFLWGLLPDNELIIRDWAIRFQVSARQPFGLIGAVGEDCAGAVQFVQLDRLDSVLSGDRDGVEWLSEADVGARLADLRRNKGAWRRSGDQGQFSLAGAQPKIALIQQGGRWGVPSGRVPTTHILKPPSAEIEAQAENEHFCLSVLGRFNLPVPASRVQRFGEEIAIVVERYDRFEGGDGIVRRFHQEDFCQALGASPDKKYQNQGGPGLKDLINLLREVSASPQEDIDTLVTASIFNWMIGGSDAHAKNFSLLLGAAGSHRLAPIYDVASILPYSPQVQFEDIKLAMKIGREYRLRDIGLKQWGRFAEENRLDFEQLRARITDVAARLPDQATSARDEIAADGAPHPLNDKLTSCFINRAAWVQKELEKATAS
jgi:serine/threonine-protein kinase HipA